MQASNPYEPRPYVKLEHPAWSKNATIYELNTRQFTEEGTFRAAERHLPRLKALGADILWLMPIYEIGEVNRKGSLGSPYAVKNYLRVNPEFGTLDDLKHFVDAAHAMDMHVILDWIANHTAWDNVLASEHPEWYLRDRRGRFRPSPWEDWADIIDLDYSHPGLRRYMTEALTYWVAEADVDGYRCDVAGFVPIDFWNHVRKELDAIKPVFMLAEWESRDLHAEAFDMTYAWTWNQVVRGITTGDGHLRDLIGYYSWNENAYPENIMRMNFVSNHDHNTWEGTQFERFGEGLEAAIVLSVVGEGMPLIYSGQEAGNPKRLAFFEKDPIVWREHPIGDLYRTLFALKRETTALWNARWGARMVQVVNSEPDAVFSFVRQNDRDKVFAAINFSDEEQTVAFGVEGESPSYGEYTAYFSGATVRVDADTRVTLEPWGYRVLVA
jgi:glycosidase